MQFSFGFEEERLSRIRERLLAAYGPARDAVRHDPASQLFKAIISSRTRDMVSEAAFQRLSFACSCGWHALATAAEQDVLGLIQPVTHAEKKAAYVVESARMIVAERGAIELGFLAERPVESAFAWLMRLRGVGPKCAAATLNFSTLRMRTLAVDTHVMRLAKRLGLVPGKATFGKAHRVLLRLMPDAFNSDDLYELHWLMKTHGQAVCAFSSPRCSTCVLADLCAGRSERSRNEFIQI